MTRKLIWPFAFNFLLFASIAALLPFLVLHYQNLGFSGAQIGLLTGITPLITLVSAPLWTNLADRTGRHNVVLAVVLAGACLDLVLFPFFHTFASVLVLVVVFNIFFGPLISFANSASMAMLKDRRELYGRVRLGGTLGFGITAAVTGGLYERFGLETVFWACALIMLLNLGISWKLEFDRAPDSASSRRLWKAFLSRPHWLIFLALAFTGGAAISLVGNYLFPAIRTLGGAGSLMGITLAAGTIAEIPLLIYSDRLLKRFKPGLLFKLALLFSSIRAILYSLASTPSAFVWIHLLNGFSAPLFWTMGVAYADEHAPEGLRTTAQGLFGAAVNGVGSAAGGFLGGLLLQALDGQSLFLVSGSAILSFLVAVSLLQSAVRRLQP